MRESERDSVDGGHDSRGQSKVITVRRIDRGETWKYCPVVLRCWIFGLAVGDIGL